MLGNVETSFRPKESRKGSLFPYFILRMSGLPSDYVEALRAGACKLLLDRLHDINVRLQGEPNAERTDNDPRQACLRNPRQAPRSGAGWQQLGSLAEILERHRIGHRPDLRTDASAA